VTAMGREWRASIGHALAWLAVAVALPVLSLAAGTGTLYELHAHGLLAVGPRVPESLPLEALAGHDAQPVVRTASAWASVGAAAGVCAAALESQRFPTALGLFAIGAAGALVGGGALSDALTQNQPLTGHLLPQLASGAVAFAWGALVCGAALVGSALVRSAGAGRGRRR